MPYFPIFLDLRNRPITVLGAGEVASRKIEKLLPFEPNLTVIAPRVSSEIEQWALESRLTLIRKKVTSPEELGVSDLVIVAIDDIGLQKQIFEWCKAKNIPCNSVDSPDYCSFIFPALVLRGDMTVAISTGGKAPALSAKMRAWLDEWLPRDLGEVVEKVQAFRKSKENRSLSTFIERAKKVGDFAESLLQSKHSQTPAPQAKTTEDDHLS